MSFTQYFYKRTVASLCHANNRLVKRPSVHLASTAYGSRIWVTYRPQFSVFYDLNRRSLYWHHVLWFMISILKYIIICLLRTGHLSEHISWTLSLTEDASRVHANHEAIEGSTEDPARRCGEDRSPPSPATSCGWTGPPLPLHFTHHVTPRPHHSTSSTSRLEQMWEPRRATVALSLGALHGTRPTRRDVRLLLCAGFPASDTSFTEHRSMPKHVSEQTIW